MVVRHGDTFRVAGVLSGGSQREGYNYAALLDRDGHERTYEFVRKIVRKSRMNPNRSGTGSSGNKLQVLRSHGGIPY